MKMIRKQVGDTNLRLLCDDSLAAQGEWLIGVVASFRDKGAGLIDGANIQVGWSLLRLVQDGKELSICEPDFDGDPLTKVRSDTSTTLRILLAQNAFLSRLKTEGLAARFDDKVVLKKGCLNQQRIWLNGSSQNEATPAGISAPSKKD